MQIQFCFHQKETHTKQIRLQNNFTYTYIFIFYILFILSSANDIQAQQLPSEKTNNVIAGVKMGPGFTTFYDEAISKQPFNGTTATGAISFQFNRNVWLHEIAFSFLNGSLSNEANKNYNATIASWSLDYQLLYSLKAANAHNPWILNAGLVLQNKLETRQYELMVNNNKSSEQSMGIAAKLAAGYAINPEGNSIVLYNQSSIGLVAFANQSSFGNSNADGSLMNQKNEVADLFKNGSIISLSKYVAFKNEMSIAKKMNEHHVLCFHYLWQINKLKINRETLLHAHQFQLQYQYIF